MLHVQLRRYLPDAVTPAEVLDVQEIQTSKVGSASAALTLKVSLAMSDGIRDWIAQNPGKAYVVGIEYAVDGGDWFEPRDNLFVAYKGTADDTDPAETQQITCVDWVTWQLARTYVHWTAAAKNNERTWTAASAGASLFGLLTESKARGWGPQFGRDFTTALDSAGVAWAAADKIEQTWRLLTPLTQVLGSLTEQGMCDWWSEGTKLRLFRPGVGVDHTEIVLGGNGYSRAPGSWDFSNVFTHLTVVPEKASYWLYLDNAGADNPFGRLEATMTQSDVADHPTATRLARPMLDAGRTAKREQSYEWTVAGDMPMPWVDFNVHDLVTIDTAFGTREERVVELVVRVRDGVVTCVAVTGDKMLSAIARKDRRAQAAVIGNIIGGSGNGLPGATGPTIAAPVAPTGVHIVSNVGSWRADGTAQATVAVGWDAVTQTEDGSEVDVRGYEVAHRTATSEPVIARTTGIAFTATDWEPGVARYVKVRALPQVGAPSAWSAEIAIVPEVPGIIVPKAPTGLAVTSNTAVFQADGTAIATITVGWTAVTESLDNTPVVAQDYEVRIGLDTQRVTGTTATFTVPSSRQVSVSVRVRTTLDIWGDPSTPLNVTGAAPTVSTTAPSTPVLTAGLGGVGYRWNGLSSTSSAMPAGFGRVVAETAAVAAGPWTAQGATLSAAGGGSVSASPGSAVFVRFRAYDTLGRLTGTSAVASATAQGVSLDDIDPDLSGELDEIRHTADGKNRIYTSNVSPGVATVARVNYALYPEMRGAVAGWASSGGAAASLTPTASGVQLDTTAVFSSAPLLHSAAAVASAAGHRWSAAMTFTVPVGFPTVTIELRVYSYGQNAAVALSGVKTIAAGETVTLNALAMADVTAATTGVRIIAYIGCPSGARVIASDALLERTSTPGKQFSGSTPPEPRLGRRWQGVVGNSASEELASAFSPGDQWWQLDPTLTSIVGVKVWNGLAWVNYQIVAQDIIAAGTITGLHVEANTLGVNHVEPSFGDDLNLSANESVTIIVGRQNEQADQIADVSEGVGAAQSAADAASSAAGSAQATANGAASTAAGAAAAASDVGQRLDRHQTYYRFGVDGLAIGDPNVASELRLKPDRIEMTQNNVVVSYWEGGVFVADEARLDSAQIGNHQFMAYGAGRTIVRPL